MATYIVNVVSFILQISEHIFLKRCNQYLCLHQGNKSKEDSEPCLFIKPSHVTMRVEGNVFRKFLAASFLQHDRQTIKLTFERAKGVINKHLIDRYCTDLISYNTKGCNSQQIN